MTEKINSFDDLWTTYNTLQWEMMEKKKQAIVDYMEEAKKYVNGLTDGWFEFKFRVDQMEKMWGSQLDGQAGQRYRAIKNCLEQMLSNR